MSTQVRLRAHENVLPRLWAYLSALLHWVRMSVSPSLRLTSTRSADPDTTHPTPPPLPASRSSQLHHRTTPPLFGRLPGAEA